MMCLYLVSIQQMVVIWNNDDHYDEKNCGETNKECGEINKIALARLSHPTPSHPLTLCSVNNDFADLAWSYNSWVHL